MGSYLWNPDCNISGAAFAAELHCYGEEQPRRGVERRSTISDRQRGEILQSNIIIAYHTPQDIRPIHNYHLGDTRYYYDQVELISLLHYRHIHACLVTVISFVIWVSCVDKVSPENED